MDAVNLRALGYYRSRGDIASLNEESLARRARILHAIGEDELARDHLDDALRAFWEARQTTAELVLRAPNDPARLLEHAKSDFGIGRVYELRDDWSVAQRHYLAFAGAADRLLASQPNNPDFMMKSAAAALDVGTIQMNGLKDVVAAQRSYEKAVDLLARADRARPNDAHVLPALANAYAWLAESFYARKMWCEALANRWRQLPIALRAHVADPENSDLAFRLAAARRGLAYALARVGERGEAERQRRDAEAAMADLVALEPRNAEWRGLRAKLAADVRRLPAAYREAGRLRCANVAAAMRNVR